jgi:F-type H+-transporting ATPase subunit epsilon
MQLEILLPSEVFIAGEPITRIVVQTPTGSLGLLPRRRDCVAALSPGILNYSTVTGTEVYLAVDQGVLFKTGSNVLVCVRRAIRGNNLGELRQAVEREFLRLDEGERTTRSALALAESGFIRRIVEFQRV